MSEKRKKKKDDTYTKEELSAALGRDKSKKGASSADSRAGGSSAHASSSRNASEKDRSSKKKVYDKDRKDAKGNPPSKESDVKKKTEGAEKSRQTSSRKHEEEATYSRDHESRRRESKEKKKKQKDSEIEDVEKEKRKEKRDSKKSKTEEYEDVEKEIRRKEKEERRRRREEEKRTAEEPTDEETRRREKEERRRRRAEEKRSREDVADEEEIRRREKEERRKRREEEKRARVEDTERDEHSRSKEHRKRSSKGSRTSLREDQKASEKELRREKGSRDKESRDKKSRDKKSSRHRLVEDEDHERTKPEINVRDTSSASSKISKDVNDYNYDDDDFVDYEDDFDEDKGETSDDVRDIISAMREENLRVTSARTASSRSDRTASPDRAASPHLGITSINFSAAKKAAAGSRVAKTMLKRRNELINLIQLDVISFDLFELAPVTEYNFYIKSFGNKNTRQCSTQCNDDALEVETQTDFPDLIEKWTQHPQDGAFACGGAQEEDLGSSHIESLLTSMQEGTQRFSTFLDYAGSLVESAFAETKLSSGKKEQEGSVLSCCESCTKFNTNLAYLQGRQVIRATFGEGGLVAIAFGLPKNNASARLDRKGLVTVWKPGNTDQPDKILVCDAVPAACCFVPKKMHLLLVGTDEGSVLVFDLNEPANMHISREIEKHKMSVLRSPTYTTGFQNKIHANPIVYLNPVGTYLSSNQVFSLDEGGRLCIWTVVDILTENEDDLGLAPQGHVKLLKTTPIDVRVPKNSASHSLGIRATCAVCPDATVFYVGMEGGSVLSLTRERRLKNYRSPSVGDVTSISMSKLNSMLMLVAHKDGTIVMFHVKQEIPLMTWTIDGDILFCDWSNCRASVFFALSSTNHLHVWDLMALDSGPLVSDIFQQKTRHFCVDSHARKTTDLLVAYDSCTFEIHRISSRFTASMTSDESDQMMSLLMSFA